MDENTRVLFIHGLESGPTGLKANVLRQHYKHFSCPHLRSPKNLWKSLTIIIQEVRSFKPTIIIGSSYGSILLLLLLQMGIWNGPSIIIACAMQLLAKHRMYLPPNVNPNNILFIHGINDTLCDITYIRQMTSRHNIELIEYNDTHSLKTICTEPISDCTLIQYTTQMIDQSDGGVIEDNRTISSYLLKLTFIILWSVVRYPFNRCFL